MKTRVISAAILIAIILPILIIGGDLFKFFIVLVGVLGLKELIALRKKKHNIPFIMEILSYILFVLFIILNKQNIAYLKINYIDAIVFLLVMLLPIVFINNREKYNISDALFLIGSIILICVGFNSFIMIRNHSLSLLIYLALITTMTDTFALFTGMFIGKHKLCKNISPNKTIEGAIGGSLMGTIIASLFYIFVIGNSNILFVLGITFLLTVVGQVGDLLFSSIKRNYDVKDFSNLIPGHGGILDRFDSLILVVMTYLLFVGIL